jgi:hypothetical protein
MAAPTLPSLWADVLIMLNTFLAWDVVKGFIVLSLGMSFGSLALRMLGRAVR